MTLNHLNFLFIDPVMVFQTHPGFLSNRHVLFKANSIVGRNNGY